MTPLSDALRFSHGPTWSHRVALAPLTNMQSNADGTLGDDEYAWLIRRAEGGFAMTMTCAANISPEGQTFPGQLAAWDSRFVPGLARLANGIREAGSVSSLQLQHGGRRADPALSGREVVAPWEDPTKGARALTTDEVHRIIDDFIAAAVLAEKAGFHGVEVHGAHGYLLCQFLDGRNNLRADGFGGAAADRFRIIHDVIDGIRAATGPDFQLGLRLTPERNGVLLAEARLLASEVLARGHLDYLDVSLWDAFKAPHESGYDGLLIDHFVDLPRGETRLGVAGNILDAAGARWCLDRGADFVLIGTGGILHHDFARRALHDPDFRSIDQPVSRDHLIAESLGNAFIDYLATQWDDFVG